MMSKTHIAVGVAAALAVAQTASVESLVCAVIGGSVGGVIADCDITPSRAHKDALTGRLVVIGIVLLALAADRWLNAGVCDYLAASLGAPLIIGVVLFCALTFAGSHTDHRTFTHSLVAMAAFCVTVHLMCPPVLPYFAMGYASHLLLDVANKQAIRLLWPFDGGASLGLCAAKGVANTVLMFLGVAASVLLAAYRLAPLLGVSVGLA